MPKSAKGSSLFGFSLLELVAVLAVMGTLAAVAVPVYGVVNENSARGALISSAEGIVNSANSRAQSDTLNPARETTINDIVLGSPDNADVSVLPSASLTSGVMVTGQQDLCIDVYLAQDASDTQAIRGEPYGCDTASSVTSTTTPSSVTTIPSGSTTSTTVVAQLVPVSPTITNVSIGNLSLTVNFAATSSQTRPVSSVNVSIGSSPIVLEASATSYTFTGLQAGTVYVVSVTSINSAGESTSTQTVTAVSAPSTVTGVQVVSTGPTTATLSWTPVSSTTAMPVTGYQVSTVSSGVLTLVGLTSSSSMLLTGLTPGSTYSYVVSAYNSDIAGGSSTPADLLVVTTPAAPVISSTTTGTLSVTINFSSPSETDATAVESYVLYKDAVQVAVVSSTVSSYTFTGLTESVVYAFTVKARNSAGDSQPDLVSQQAYAIPAAPASLAVVFSESSSSSLNLSWSPVSSASGYYVYMLSSSTGVYEMLATSSSSSYVASSLTPGVSYSFKVAAYTSNLLGAQSSAASATPGVFAPSSLSTTATDTSIVLVWQHSPLPSSIASYSVHNASTGSILATVSAGTLTSTVSALTQNTAYSFYVKSTDADGRVSQASDTSSISTLNTPPPAPVIYWSGLNSGLSISSVVVSNGVLSMSLPADAEDAVEDPQACWVADSDATGYQVYVLGSSGVYVLDHVVSKPSSGWSSETCSNPLVLTEMQSYDVRVTAYDAHAAASVYSNTKGVTKGRAALRGIVTAYQPAVPEVAAVTEVPYRAPRAAVYGTHPTYQEDRGSWVTVQVPLYVSSVYCSPCGEQYLAAAAVAAAYTYMEVQPPISVAVNHVHETNHVHSSTSSVRGSCRIYAPGPSGPGSNRHCEQYNYSNVTTYTDHTHYSDHTHYNLYPNMQWVLTTAPSDAVYANHPTTYHDNSYWTTTPSTVWSANVVTLGGGSYLVSAADAGQAYVAPVAYSAYRAAVAAVIGITRPKVFNAYR